MAGYLPPALQQQPTTRSLEEESGSNGIPMRPDATHLVRTDVSSSQADKRGRARESPNSRRNIASTDQVAYPSNKYRCPRKGMS